jgi:hypothetical protein
MVRENQGGETIAREKERKKGPKLWKDRSFSSKSVKEHCRYKSKEEMEEHQIHQLAPFQ